MLTWASGRNRRRRRDLNFRNRSGMRLFFLQLDAFCFYIIMVHLKHSKYQLLSLCSLEEYLFKWDLSFKALKTKCISLSTENFVSVPVSKHYSVLNHSNGLSICTLGSSTYFILRNQVFTPVAICLPFVLLYINVTELQCSIFQVWKFQIAGSYHISP